MGYAQSKDQSQKPTSKSPTNASGRLYATRADEFSTRTLPNTVQICSTSENRALFGNFIPYFHMLSHYCNPAPSVETTATDRRHNATTTKECQLTKKECKPANEFSAYDYCDKADIRGPNSEDYFGNGTPLVHSRLRSSQSIIERSVRLYPNLAEENPTYDVPNTVDFRSRPSTEVYVGNTPYRDVLRPTSTERLYPDLAYELSTYSHYDKVDIRGAATSEACWEKANFHEQRYNHQPDVWMPPAYTPSAGSWAPPAYSVPPALAAPPAYSVEPSYLATPTSSLSPRPRPPPTYLAPSTSSISPQPRAQSAYLAPPTSSVSPVKAAPALIKKTPKNRKKNKLAVASSTYLAPSASSAPPTPKTPEAYSTTPSEAPRAPTVFAKTPKNKKKKVWVAKPGSSTPSIPKAPVVYSTTLMSSEAFRAPTAIADKNSNRYKNKALVASPTYSATTEPLEAHTAPPTLAANAPNRPLAPRTPKTPVAYSTTRTYKPSDAPNALPALTEKPSKRRNRNKKNNGNYIKV